MRGILRKASIAAIAMFVTMGLAPKAEAALVQIGSYQSGQGNYTYTAGSLSGTTTTASSFTFDPAFATIFGLPTTTYTNVQLTIDADATGAVTSGGFPTTLSQPMSGFIVVTDLNTNQILVQTNFTSAFLTGALGGNTVALIGSSGFGTTITYSSNVFNAALVGPPNNFTFTLNPTSVAVAQSGSNFANFAGPDTANFSTTVQTTPEPASLALFGLGLTAAGALARKRRRK